MYIITFENEIYQQRTCEYVFNEFEEAKEYLLQQGFIEKNRLFERKNHNWSKYIKAYITPRKVYDA